MSNCNKCFNNTWKFEKIEKIIRATCQFCDYEVEFPARNEVARKPKLIKKKIDRYKECRKCGGKLEAKNAKVTAKKLKRNYFYSQFYRCTNCKNTYYFPKDQVPTTQLGILDKTNLLNN